MKSGEIRKLLGGYATGTLTEQERKTLFEAALRDQALFDELAREEALREALDDPAYRQGLAAELAAAPRPSQLHRLSAWWSRPLPLAFAGGAAVVLLAGVMVQQFRGPAERTTELAMVRESAQPAVIEPSSPAPTETDLPAAPPAPTPEAEKGKAKRQAEPEPATGQAPIPGGVIGGVIGGIIGGVPPSPPESDFARGGAEQAAPSAGPPPVSRAKSAAATPRNEAEGELADARRQALRERAAADQDPEFAGRAPAPPPPAAPVGAAEAESRFQRADLAAGALAPKEMAAAAPVLEARRLAVRGSAVEAGSMTEAKEAAALTLTVEQAAGGGRWMERRATDTFLVSDRLRLRVRAPRAGYLYLLETPGDGPPRLLFSGEARAGEAVYVPAAGATLVAPLGPGERDYLLLFSEQPIPLPQLGVGGDLDPATAEAAIPIRIAYR